MSMTIGRASLATDPSSITQNGDQLTFTVDVLESSLAASKAIRMQLLGLERGEVIPMTWSGDSDYDGFYVVEGVSVAPVTTYQQNYLMRAALTVSRVRGGAYTASLEIAYIVSLRSTSNLTPPFVSSAQLLFPNPLASSRNGVTLSEKTTDTGDLARAAATVGSSSFTYDLAPADFYDGACLIEQQDDGGSTWRAVVGRDLQTRDQEKCRVGNGILRFYWDNTTELVVDAFDGSAWAEAQRFSFEVGGNTFRPQWGARILRNSPESVSVQYSLVQASTAISNRSLLTLTLHRGQVFIEGGLFNPTAASWSVGASTTIAATDSTYLVEQTSASANDTKFVLSSPNDWTADTTNGRIDSVGTDQSVDLMLGIEIDVAGAGVNQVGPNTIIDYYWRAQSQRQRVVT